MKIWSSNLKMQILEDYYTDFNINKNMDFTTNSSYHCQTESAKTRVVSRIVRKLKPWLKHLILNFPKQNKILKSTQYSSRTIISKFDRSHDFHRSELSHMDQGCLTETRVVSRKYESWKFMIWTSKNIKHFWNRSNSLEMRSKNAHTRKSSYFFQFWAFRANTITT